MCMKKHDNRGDINPCCFTCCPEKKFITDKLCCDFVSAAGTTTIFTGDLSVGCDIVASGSIKNCGTATLTVTFLRGVSSGGTGGTPVRTVMIPAGGCVTFTVSRFDAITVSGGTADVPVPGEICIIQRFRVS
ncbi:S-Ena type endospore appendage [Bacillus sp. 1P10SD]|uniref:S-Ena type endospore appendage n=1 Tax=Bacillus sp. 1P10SD TaxID=3132265 RepID=UPI0039A42796